MTKLLNIAKLFMMVKVVSELGSWSFRQFVNVNKQKKKKETIPCHLFPFCIIPILKHISTDLRERERERERKREREISLRKDPQPNYQQRNNQDGNIAHPPIHYHFKTCSRTFLKIWVNRPSKF